MSEHYCGTVNISPKHLHRLTPPPPYTEEPTHSPAHVSNDSPRVPLLTAEQTPSVYSSQAVAITGQPHSLQGQGHLSKEEAEAIESEQRGTVCLACCVFCFFCCLLGLIAFFMAGKYIYIYIYDYGDCSSNK